MLTKGESPYEKDEMDPKSFEIIFRKAIEVNFIKMFFKVQFATFGFVVHIPPNGFYASDPLRSADGKHTARFTG